MCLPYLLNYPLPTVVVRQLAAPRTDYMIGPSTSLLDHLIIPLGKLPFADPRGTVKIPQVTGIGRNKREQIADTERAKRPNWIVPATAT